AFGLEHGVLCAGMDARGGVGAPVQIGSVDTVVSRVLQRRTVDAQRFDLVVVDEAHLSVTETRQRLLALYPDAVRVGLTATPTRKDGRALGLLYDKLLEPATPAGLTAACWLGAARHSYCPPPDLHVARTIAGRHQPA